MVRADVFGEWGWPVVVEDEAAPRMQLSDVLLPAEEVAELFL